ncbi:bromodomain-containing protein 7 isoform X1 [Chiloscyllium plagiosum]|uniref:bromodomain-containing protein 7 isoform X1 n=1 Tax=Chiloscyllium plagiosum TaxID=36176 RepID=UPI001CB7D622|nr:bromodomain-containing protein 7 isoform X1 [Chiloscyllium plagiosum]
MTDTRRLPGARGCRRLHCPCQSRPPMGRKHKKHKHAAEEYTDKPLKLVLKVGGSEITELSTASLGHESSLIEDKCDHDKHKEKKKKKKKKTEKEKRTTPDERKRRKDEKRKREKELAISEREEEERSRSPARFEMPPERHMTSPLIKIEEYQTPFQELQYQLLRQLQRKDPNAFFSFPVTDFIAPGYSLIIKHPMDFSSMKEKVKKNEYQDLEELKGDFKMMCENAMTYNRPDTIYYKAAKKLLHSGMKILSQEKIQSLKQSIDFMQDLEKSHKQGEKLRTGDYNGERRKDEGDARGESMQTDDRDRSTDQQNEDQRLEKESSEDTSSSGNHVIDRELEKVDRIIEESSGKLTRRKIDSKFEFQRRKVDGTTTLGILNVVEPDMGDPSYCPVKLGMMAGRLQSGINTLQGFKEDKRNKVIPVTYLNYGPFSSYAPVYDSTCANLSKEDSDLVYSTYGDELGMSGSFSVQQFLASNEDYSVNMVDNLLDSLTNGEHSKTMKELEITTHNNEDELNILNTSEDVQSAPAESPRPPLESGFGRVNDSFASLQSVISGEPESEESGMFQKKLDETTKLLQDLQQAQNERFSTRPPSATLCLFGPSIRELLIAERVTGNLKELASQVAPGDITSVAGIRKAMGITVPLEMMDSSSSESLSGARNSNPVEEMGTTELPELEPVVSINEDPIAIVT